MSQTYPLVCTKGVIIFPDQEIVIDVGREASLKAVENARDNYEDKVVLFSQVKLQQENPTFDDIYHVGTLCEIRHVRKFENFLRAFVDLKVPHIQFNVVRKEDLLDAKVHPENHQSLTIRVAGYTAYFVELAGKLQDEIIERTTYENI